MNRKWRRKARKRKRYRRMKRAAKMRILQFRIAEQDRYIKQIEDGAVRTAVDLAYTRAALKLAQTNARSAEARADLAETRALEAERAHQDTLAELATWRREARGAERAQA